MGQLKNTLNTIITLLMLVPLCGLSVENEGRISMQPGDIIQEAHIGHLPGPVQKYIRFTGLVGTPMISEVTLEQKGLFKTSPERSWTPFKSTQTYHIQEASFEWRVKMKMAPLMIVTGRDRLMDGQGHMLIKLFGLFPLVNAKGPEMDQGSMTRHLSEMIWFPQAFLDDHVSWEAIDSTSAKATLSIGEKQVSGVFHFDGEGRITEFRCDRYYAKGKEVVIKPWRTPVDEYQEINGIMLGVKGRAIWDLPEGEYCYVDIEITDVSYR